MATTPTDSNSTRILVLGAGMVGSVIAADLALDLTRAQASLDDAPADERFRVRVADASEQALAVAARRTRGQAQFIQADLSDPTTLARLVADADIVVNALPGWLGYRALEAIITVGRPCCDIAFMPEDATALNTMASERGVLAITDCGVAPGMSNVFAGLSKQRLSRMDRLSIMVGGLPKHPQPPFQYKAPFSPSDVLEEYTRPARLRINGQLVTRPALSEIEHIETPQLGTLEAFNTDGLRSLLDTMDAPTLLEKTLRYPGHAAMMRSFRDAGLFDQDPVPVRTANGTQVQVRPIDVTSRVLFPKWTYAEGEADATYMRVVSEGLSHEGAMVRHRWDLYDEFDPRTGFPSMSRVTAFPCTTFVRMIAEGLFSGMRGVLPPESIITEFIATRLLAEMEARNVRYQYVIEPIT
jgi:saccharopine dehydrogenase-like NADP-dependent oxidoreductase